MDNLFVLYHYLVRSRSRSDESNPYNVALQSVHNLLEIIREMDYSAECVRENGGFEWDRANRIVSMLIQGHQIALLDHHNGAKNTVVAIIEKYLRLEDFDYVIAEMGRIRKAVEARNAELGEIDEHPF